MEPLLWVLFVLACVLVSFVILIQEGKGGGLGEAFGGAGQQAFGVKAAGINKFTGWVSLAIVVLAIMITILRQGGTTLSFPDAAPAPEGAVVAPAGDGAGGEATGGDAGGGTAGEDGQ